MDEEAFIERQITFMDRIIKAHDAVKNIHVSLEKLYPITVINDGYFFVFNINKNSGKYELMFKAKMSISMSGDILAAFHLDFFDMKPSAVVSKNILENKENNIFILREFVHCFQLENGANEIRKELSIHKQEMAKNNYNWEINFPFPYNNEYFVDKTVELSDYFAKGNFEKFEVHRNCMRAYLQKSEYEYMIWHEWKEGFAKYVENLIRRELGLQLKANILRQPFDRAHFHEIGNKYVEMLIEKDRGLNDNIVKLFYKMIICE